MDSQSLADLVSWLLAQDPLLLLVGYFLVRSHLTSKNTLDVLSSIIEMLDTTRPDSKETPTKPA